MPKKDSVSDSFIAGELEIGDVDEQLFLSADEVTDIDPLTTPDDDDDVTEHPETGDDDDNKGDENDDQGEAKKDSPDSPDKKDKEEGDDNEFYLRGVHWKETGRLAHDVEIPKNVTQLDLEDLYLAQVEKNTVNQLKTQYGDILKARGINPDEIFTDDPNFDAAFQKQYEVIAAMTYESLLEKEEDVTATLRNIGEEYHLSRNEKLDDDEVKALVDTDLKKNSEEDLFDKYKTYFGKEAKRMATKIQTDAENKRKDDLKKATDTAAYIKEALSKKGYKDDQIKYVQDAFTVKNQVYDNGKGVRTPRITLIDKLQREAENNIDLLLEQLMPLLFKNDKAAEKEKNNRVVVVDTLSKIAKASGLTGLPNNNKSQNKKTNKDQDIEVEELFL